LSVGKPDTPPSPFYPNLSKQIFKKRVCRTTERRKGQKTALQKYEGSYYTPFL